MEGRRSRPVTLICWVLVLPWLAWAAVRTFGLDGSGVVLSVIAFTPYAALTSILPLLLTLALRRWAPAGVAAIAGLALLVAVLPRALPDAGTADRDGPVLTVMQLNMDDGRADPEVIARLVREHDVDVLSLQELKSSLPGLDAAGLDELLPSRLVAPRSRAGGSALLADQALRALPSQPTSTNPSSPRAALRVGRRTVELTTCHPPHPTQAEFEGAWKASLRSLPSAGQTTAVQLIVGDLNATLDHGELRDVVARGYRDAADAEGAGLRPTWPTRRSRSPGITIDHVLVDARAAVLRFATYEVPGSDHRAIIAAVRVPRVRESEPAAARSSPPAC